MEMCEASLFLNEIIGSFVNYHQWEYKLWSHVTSEYPQSYVHHTDCILLFTPDFTQIFTHISQFNNINTRYSLLSCLLINIKQFIQKMLLRLLRIDAFNIIIYVVKFP